LVVYYLNLYARHTQTTRRVSWLGKFSTATQYDVSPLLFFKCAEPYKAETFSPCVYPPAASVCEKHETTTSWQDRLLLRLYT
jgi:hypothetical protein